MRLQVSTYTHLLNISVCDIISYKTRQIREDVSQKDSKDVLKA